MKYLRTLFLGALAGGLFATAATAQISAIPSQLQPQRDSIIQKAQFKLPFGMSSKSVRDTLRRDGFEEIDVTFVGVIAAKAEACRQGRRYAIKLRIDGTYEERREIGRCRKAIAQGDVEEILRKEGYRRLDVQDDGRLPYLASGCRNGDRFELRVSEYGEVEVGKRIGQCRREQANLISPRDLRLALRKDGFNRIRFTDRSERRFTIEACDNRNSRIRLTINRRGRIRNQERIGQCAPRIQASDIPAMLRKDGFNRIDVVDEKPPRYRAEACDAQNNRIRVSISPWGRKVQQRKVGECDPPMTVASLTERLRDSKKFKGIRVREGKRYPFVATLCADGDQREVYFSKWGQPEGGKDLGRCVSKRINQVLNGLRDEGISQTQVFVEGCRRDRRIRFTFDEFGNQLSRERVGRCN